MENAITRLRASRKVSIIDTIIKCTFRSNSKCCEHQEKCLLLTRNDHTDPHPRRARCEHQEKCLLLTPQRMRMRGQKMPTLRASRKVSIIDTTYIWWFQWSDNSLRASRKVSIIDTS